MVSKDNKRSITPDQNQGANNLHSEEIRKEQLNDQFQIQPPQRTRMTKTIEDGSNDTSTTGKRNFENAQPVMTDSVTVKNE